MSAGVDVERIYDEVRSKLAEPEPPVLAGQTAIVELVDVETTVPRQLSIFDL